MRTPRSLVLLVCLASCCGGGNAPRPLAPLVQDAVDTYLHGRDAGAVQEELEEAVAADPDDPLLLAMAGDAAYFRGDFDRSMTLYARAVRAASAWESDLRDPLTETSLATIASMDVYVPRYESRLADLHEAVLDDLYRTTDGAYFVALKGRIRALARAGRFDQARELMEQGGCLTRFRAAGPFGETELLHFDDEHPPERDMPWREAYALREGAEPVATFEATTLLGKVLVEPEQNLGGGTYYAATDVTVHRPGRYVLRVASPHTTSVLVDGVTVLTLDRRTAYEPAAVLYRVHLAAGEHRLTVKLGTRDVMPEFSLMIKEDSGGSPDPSATPAVTSRPHTAGFSAIAPPPGEAVRVRPPEPTSEIERFVAAELALVRQDAPAARRALSPLIEASPGSSTLLVRRLTLELNDPFVPYSKRMNRLLALAEEAVTEHPSIWPSHMLIARLEAGQDRTEQAIAAVKEGIEVIGDLPGFHATLATLYASKGWVGESVAALEKAAASLEDNCQVPRYEREIAEAFGDLDAIEHWSREIVACDATDTALFEILMRREKYEQARQEQERLQQLFPDADVHLLDDASIALKLGDMDLYISRLTDYHEIHPTSYLAISKLVDAHVADGRRGRAVSLLEQARADLEGPTDDISMTIALLMGHEFLYPFRRDARTAIAAYEARASGGQPATPSVEILDHVTHRVFRDGSTLTRYHSVRKLLTKEGVEENSEFVAPPGASVIQLRTIKADGRVLTPEDIAHKATISFPSLEPGDYTEAEWLQARGPSLIFPGGFSLDRWYFQILDLVLHLSEMIVVAPEDMALSFDPRQDPPELVHLDESPLKVLTWTAHDMPHRKMEPNVPNLSEFLPSLELSHGTSWDRYFEWLADMLVDVNIPSDAMREKVEELVADIPAQDHEARARAVFRWVNDEIDEGEGLDRPVSYIFEERMGNRSRLLYAMLELAGVPAELWIVRTAYADHTETEVPDFDVYTQLAVRVGDDWLVPFVDTTPYGLLAHDLRGERAVRLFPSRAHGVTPGAEEFEDLHRRELTVTVEQSGRSRCRLVETYLGIDAAMLRAGLDRLPESDLENAIETVYLADLFNGASLTSLALPDLDDDAPQMTLEVEFTLPALPGPMPGTIALGPFLKSHLSKIWTQLPERHFPLFVDEPTNAVVEVVVDTNGEWKVFQPPAPATELGTSRGASFEQEVTEEGDDLVLERRVHLPAGRVPPEDYPELLDFATRVDETEGGVYVLMRSELAQFLP
jgi:tetratricopeptide (TPR) repeat protein